jgi:RNA polymerase sigma factor (sigma-70 family)
VEALIELSEVVRRVVGARVRDAHLVEDLTQETLVRVAAAQPRLGPEALQAYAIVTARNVVVSHARSTAVHARNVHRVVDYTSLDGPEALTLEREETDALTVALQKLDAPDRELLLRHEAEGVSTDTLASETGSTKGAIAMRLARARATLRLEFLLAFRRVDLPSQHCRHVLLALSAGDRRRQDSLDAGAHLLHCATCARLARPVSERRRGIAGWLFLPIAEGVRRAVRSLRQSRVTPAAVVAVVAVGTIALVGGAVLLRTDGPERPSVRAPSPTLPLPTAAPARSTASVTASPCPAALALEQLGTAALGCPIAPTHLTVTDVPADEGFWAQSASGLEVWVQLTGEGESPVDVQPGASLLVAGTVSDPAAAGPMASDPRVARLGYVVVSSYADVAVA